MRGGGEEVVRDEEEDAGRRGCALITGSDVTAACILLSCDSLSLWHDDENLIDPLPDSCSGSGSGPRCRIQDNSHMPLLLYVRACFSPDSTCACACI